MRESPTIIISKELIQVDFGVLELSFFVSEPCEENVAIPDVDLLSTLVEAHSE